MNELSPERLATIRRARGMLSLLDNAQFMTAKSAWRLVDSCAELDRTMGRMAAAKARKRFGHRPCARVGLKTKPFHVVQTKKGPLSACGRLLGGHRRIRLQS